MNYEVPTNNIRWVDAGGEPLPVSGETAANDHLIKMVRLVETGEMVGDVRQLTFRDPDHFRAGELHRNLSYWEEMDESVLSAERHEIQYKSWINGKVSIFPYFRHFTGSFKGEQFDSDLPPTKLFKYNVPCKPFVDFIRKTLLERLTTGAITLVARVGQVQPPHLVLPLIVEPTKPGLCYDARFLTLWMKDKPFTLDRPTDLPRYVFKDSYQTFC